MCTNVAAHKASGNALLCWLLCTLMPEPVVCVVLTLLLLIIESCYCSIVNKITRKQIYSRVYGNDLTRKEIWGKCVLLQNMLYK